jgi:hypothetical protein
MARIHLEENGGFYRVSYVSSDRAIGFLRFDASVVFLQSEQWSFLDLMHWLCFFSQINSVS